MVYHLYLALVPLVAAVQSRAPCSTRISLGAPGLKRGCHGPMLEMQAQPRRRQLHDDTAAQARQQAQVHAMYWWCTAGRLNECCHRVHRCWGGQRAGIELAAAWRVVRYGCLFADDGARGSSPSVASSTSVLSSTIRCSVGVAASAWLSLVGPHPHKAQRQRCM